jgi:hypothetical protein
VPDYTECVRGLYEAVCGFSGEGEVFVGVGKDGVEVPYL